MKLRISHFTHNGKTYFERSGDHAIQAQHLAEGVCTAFVLERNLKAARAWAIESVMRKAIADFWLNRFGGSYRHAFAR